jgi:hypothetical protein
MGYRRRGYRHHLRARVVREHAEHLAPKVEVDDTEVLHVPNPQQPGHSGREDAAVLQHQSVHIHSKPGRHTAASGTRAPRLCVISSQELTPLCSPGRRRTP